MSDPNLPEGIKQSDIDRRGEPNALTFEDEIYGEDGDQVTCVRSDFIDLQNSPCGFGNTEREALADLIRQEGGVIYVNK